MEYTEVELMISPREPFCDVLTWKLSEIGFEMFEETPSGLKAYIRKQDYDELQLSSLLQNEQNSCSLTWEVRNIPWKNWNEEWESNFQPEVIGSKIYVRAEFHPTNPSYPFEIIIQPKMAFGTGHHPTTAQVMEMMLASDFKSKTVLDMGSGTGILSILAFKLGADSVLAVDYDPISVENTRENAIRNGFPQMMVLEGEAKDIGGKKFDILLANINRNIILKDIAFYKELLNQNGTLITSGYFLDDLSVIREKASEYNFSYLKHTVKNEWCCTGFIKHETWKHQ